MFAKCLASDGRNIYHGGPNGLYAFDPSAETWKSLKAEEKSVTCLAYAQGQLWVGTEGQGLWRCELASGNWKRIAADQLPDRHIEALVIHGGDVYAGVGTTASGGLVRVDEAEKIHLFDQPSAPPAAPTDIVVTDKLLMARTQHEIYQWSPASRSWQVQDVRSYRAYPTLYPPRLFLAGGTVWASCQLRELNRWGDSPEENAQFKAAWYLPENNRGYIMNITKPGYMVDFLATRGVEVWFGGDPYVPFVSSGLFRFNLKSGEFYKFGPADGFKVTRNWHQVFAGQWVGPRLWLATSEGLCRVSPRLGGAAAPAGGNSTVAPAR